MVLYRFPDDPYDRIWSPDEIDEDFATLTTVANIYTTDVKDKPPASALQTAKTTTPAPTNQESSMIFTFSTTRAANKRAFYINTYFSEVTKLASNAKRSFQILWDKKTTEAIVPPYLGAVEHTIILLKKCPDPVDPRFQIHQAFLSKSQDCFTQLKA